MILKGTSAANGIAVGKIYNIKNDYLLDNNVFNVENEIAKLNTALDSLRISYELIINNLKKDDTNIFDTQLAMLNDPECYKQALEKIKNGLSAKKAIEDIGISYANNMLSLDNDYFASRAIDIKGVTSDLINQIDNYNNLDNINEDCIVVAEEFSIGDLLKIINKKAKGLISLKGGENAHASIISRSYNIPYIYNVDNIELLINDTNVILDANNSLVILNPNDLQINEYQKLMENSVNNNLLNDEYLNKITQTKDGHKLKLSVNISSAEEANLSSSINSDGVGLFRSEFFYASFGKLPSEDKQVELYKKILENFKDKQVKIRVLDIGGDKPLEYIDMPKEDNPMLGLRSIRYSLKQKDILITQIRALLKASIYGNLSIMFPMITSLKEIKEIKEIINDEKNILIKEGNKISDNIKIGMMIETPVTAILADKFASEVDFFSIGTNDLTQYTLVVDRNNEIVADMYDDNNEAIYRLIKGVIKGAHDNNISCSLCGELASDKKAIGKLIGMGIDELSVNPSVLLDIKKYISSINYYENE